MTQPTRPPSHAVLLSAGLGERLRPLTSDRAKPSLPLMNYPLILHALGRLKRGGVDRVAVNLHHAPESITRILELGGAYLPEIVLSPEERILGTGGGVVAALRRLGGAAPILVANGDALSDLDLARLAASHRRAVEDFGAVATLALRPRRLDDPYTPVWVDPEGALCGIGETGAKGAMHVFMGVQILEQAAIDGLPPTGPSDLMKDIYFPLLRVGKRLGAAVHDGWWVEIGTPRLYLRANLDLLARDPFLASLPPEAGRLVSGLRQVFVAGDGSGLEGSSLEECVIGEGASVGPGAAVARSLLGRGARVEKGARVEDCIVWEGARVGPGAEVMQSLVHLDGTASRVERLS